METCNRQQRQCCGFLGRHRLPSEFRYTSIRYIGNKTGTARISTNFLAACLTSSSLFVPANTIFPDLKISAVQRGSRIRTINAPNLCKWESTQKGYLWVVLSITEFLHHIFQINRLVDIDSRYDIANQSIRNSKHTESCSHENSSPLHDSPAVPRTGSHCSCGRCSTGPWLASRSRFEKNWLKSANPRAQIWHP